MAYRHFASRLRLQTPVAAVPHCGIPLLKRLSRLHAFLPPHAVSTTRGPFNQFGLATPDLVVTICAASRLFENFSAKVSQTREIGMKNILLAIGILLGAGLPALAQTGPVGSQCAADIQQFCAGKKHGSGDVRACLEANRDKVSVACKGALDTTGPGRGGRAK